VIVTPYTPGAEEEKVHDAVAGDGGSVTLGGQAVVKPAGLVGVNVTVPVNVPTAVIVTVVAAPVAPVLKFTGVVAEMRKSEGPETVVATLTNLEAVLMVPVTLTV
jgi:hypothetical protein